MGAKTSMAVYSAGDAKKILASKPGLDREASHAFAAKLFPDESLLALDDGNLSFTNPPDDEILVGCFPGVAVVAAKEYGIDYPSKIPATLLDASIGNTIHLHAMHSVVDWFAYAIWKNGELVRSVSLSPDSGVLEDIGTRQLFEIPYWEGLHPAVDPEEEPEGYPLPFHPLELGEAALLEFFGYQLEGMFDPANLEAEEIPLMRFKRGPAQIRAQPKPWWKLW